MKKRFPFVFIAASLIAIPTSYAASPDENESASTRAVPTESKITSPLWLENQGALNATQILEMLGMIATAPQRAQIGDAVNARNAAIQKANAQLSAQLQAILKTDEANLAKSGADRKEARELDLIRIRQPARYRSMMRNKKKK